jgi:hypothetical protein
MEDIIKCIAKKYVDNNDGEYVELFFPEYEVNNGMIMAWDSVGGHGEACIEYYNEGVQIPLPKDLQIMYEKNYDCELMELES